jgi:hypothetical protein
MPAKSVAQRRLMAMAEHHPEMINEKNRGVIEMGKEKLHEYASTTEKGLPKHKKKKGFGVGK